MDHQQLVAILLLSPLIGFLINGLFVKYLNRSALAAGAIGTIASSVSFACAFLLFSDLRGMPEEARHIHVFFFNWLNVGTFKADMAFNVDAISSVMILIIAGVGSLIHL